MALIGNPIVSTDFPVDYKSGNGSTTAFTLSVAPASVNSIDVQISGVSQSPQTYSVSGTTLTFSAAPPTGTNNIVVRHLGIAGIPNVPSAGSVVPSSIGTGYSLWNLSGSDVNYTTGNVGIGTASPSTKLHVASTAASATQLATFSSSGNSSSATVSSANSGGQYMFGSSAGDTIIRSESNSLCFGTASTLKFGSPSAEWGRFDSSGNLLVNTATNTNNATLNIKAKDYWAVQIQALNGSAGFLMGNVSGTTGYNALAFYNNGFSSPVGTIYVNGSSTTYNTSSDYRLKENIAPMTGALAVVKQLKPVTYTWKSTGEASQGFIAHELQEVVPDCVTGEKDAVNEDGSIKPQGIDTSFLVATLTAAIQELKAELDTTKAEVALLKASA